MSLGSKRWRVAAIGAAAAVVTTLVGMNTPASAATANPGTWVFVAQGGSVSFNGQGADLGSPVDVPECSNGVNDDDAVDAPGTGAQQDLLVDYPNDPQCSSPNDASETIPGYQAQGAMRVQANVAANGAMSSFSMFLPPTFRYTSTIFAGNHIGLMISARLTPGQVQSGTFDPVTGVATLNMKIDLVFTPLNAAANFGAISNCLSSIAATLSTQDDGLPVGALPVTPSPYSSTTGLATLADNGFAMPATTDTVTFPVCAQLYTNLALPAAAGASKLQFTMRSFLTTNVNASATSPTAQNVAGGSTVTLQGAGTDPNTVLCGTLPCPTPGPLYYKWTQLTGTPVTLSNRFAQNPTFTAPNTTEALTFKLEVADGRTTEVTSETQVYPANGAQFPPTILPVSAAYGTTTGTATVNVTASNQAPIANAGPDQSVNEGVTVNLTGAASSDPDSGPSPLAYGWSQTGGPAVTLTGATTATPSFTAPTLDCPGSKVLTFSLTVSDGAATSVADTVDITVNDVAPGGVTDGDYNGDGKADVATYNPTNGFWKVQCTGDVVFGQPGDIAVPGDYDGNGTTDIAVYVPNDSNPALTGREGQWLIKGGNSYLVGGLAGDIPVVGDFYGEGHDRPWLYRPSTGGWVTPFIAPIIFGAPNAIPVAGDYNGDGTDDLAFYVQSTGNWTVANGINVSSPTVTHFGGPGYLPAPGKYDGVPGTDLTTVKVSTGKWFHPSKPFYAVNFGDIGDVPAVGDFAGTGTQQFGRYRTSCTCEVYNPLGSLTNSIIFWGAAGYKPVNSQYSITKNF